MAPEWICPASRRCASRTAPLATLFMRNFGGPQGCALTAKQGYPISSDRPTREMLGLVFGFQDDLIENAHLDVLIAEQDHVAAAFEAVNLYFETSKDALVLGEGTTSEQREALSAGINPANISEVATGGLRRALGVPATSAPDFASDAIDGITETHSRLLNELSDMAAVFPQEAARILQVCGVRRHQYTLALGRPEHTTEPMRRADKEVWLAYKRMLGDASEADTADELIARQAALPGALGGAGLTSMAEAADRTYVAARVNSLAILVTHLRCDSKYDTLRDEIESLEYSTLP